MTWKIEFFLKNMKMLKPVLAIWFSSEGDLQLGMQNSTARAPSENKTIQKKKNPGH